MSGHARHPSMNSKGYPSPSMSTPTPYTSRSSYPTFLPFHETAKLQLFAAVRGLWDGSRWDTVIRLVARFVFAYAHIRTQCYTAHYSPWYFHNLVMRKSDQISSSPCFWTPYHWHLFTFLTCFSHHWPKRSRNGCIEMLGGFTRCFGCYLWSVLLSTSM